MGWLNLFLTIFVAFQRMTLLSNWCHWNLTEKLLKLPVEHGQARQVVKIRLGCEFYKLIYLKNLLWARRIENVQNSKQSKKDYLLIWYTFRNSYDTTYDRSSAKLAVMNIVVQSQSWRPKKRVLACLNLPKLFSVKWASILRKYFHAFWNRQSYWVRD